MRSTKFPITSLLLLTLATACTSPQREPEPNPIPRELRPKPTAQPTPEPKINPRELYIATCASCHATNGSGQLGEKTNLQHSKLDTKGTKDAIKFGKPESGMASFKAQFTDEELDSLTAHVMRLHEPPHEP
ncbi:MAG: cytochrome c [Bacteroidia bacterium]